MPTTAHVYSFNGHHLKICKWLTTRPDDMSAVEFNSESNGSIQKPHVFIQLFQGKFYGKPSNFGWQPLHTSFSIQPLTQTSQSSVFRPRLQKYHMHAIEAKSLASFLLPMLQLLPEDRTIWDHMELEGWFMVISPGKQLMVSSFWLYVWNLRWWVEPPWGIFWSPKNGIISTLTTEDYRIYGYIYIDRLTVPSRNMDKLPTF